MTCLTASSAVDDEGKLRQVWLAAGGSVGWVTAVHGGQVNVGIARTQLTVLQFRETRDVVAKFVIFPAEAVGEEGVCLTGVPLAVALLPFFQPLAPFSKRAQIENFVVWTEL